MSRNRYPFLQINEIYDLIPVYYQNFDKALIAKMCPLVAQGNHLVHGSINNLSLIVAAETGDKFCLDLFYDGGFELGRMVATMARKCEKVTLYAKLGILLYKFKFSQF